MLQKVVFLHAWSWQSGPLHRQRERLLLPTRRRRLPLREPKGHRARQNSPALCPHGSAAGRKQTMEAFGGGEGKVRSIAGSCCLPACAANPRPTLAGWRARTHKPQKCPRCRRRRSRPRSPPPAPPAESRHGQLVAAASRNSGPRNRHRRRPPAWPFETSSSPVPFSFPRPPSPCIRASSASSAPLA